MGNISVSKPKGKAKVYTTTSPQDSAKVVKNARPPYTIEEWPSALPSAQVTSKITYGGEVNGSDQTSNGTGNK